LELQFFQIHRKGFGDYFHDASTTFQQSYSSNTNNKHSQQSENEKNILNVTGTVFDSVIIKLKSLIKEMQSTVVNVLLRGFKENSKLYLNKKYEFL
jgi:hypothetical protein